MILELLLWGLMAASKFDSGYAMIPVAHPSGEVHTIAVPDGTYMEDFHAALGNAGYHYDLPQPTREEAIEYSPAFRKAAEKAIVASRNFEGQEAGFPVRSTGEPAQNTKGEPVIQVSKIPGKGHNLNVVHQPNDVAIFHTHPRGYDPRPSHGDIEDAKNNHMTIHVASPDGLWAVGPDGKPQQIFKSPTWYSDKEPK